MVDCPTREWKSGASSCPLHSSHIRRRYLASRCSATRGEFGMLNTKLIYSNFRTVQSGPELPETGWGVLTTRKPSHSRSELWNCLFIGWLYSRVDRRHHPRDQTRRMRRLGRRAERQKRTFPLQSRSNNRRGLKLIGWLPSTYSNRLAPLVEWHKLNFNLLNITIYFCRAE